MHIVIYLFNSIFSGISIWLLKSYFGHKLCEAMEILSIYCKFIELMEFIKDELHIILNSWSLLHNIIIT
jgi:hypothetical protein